MKIFSVDQIREADAYTIQHEPVASIDLMERAATACVKWIVERFDTKTAFKIVCGLGNNGGDGLAIACLLSERNYIVQVFIIRHSEKTSADFEINFQRLKKMEKVSVTEISSLADTNTLSKKLLQLPFSFGEGAHRADEVGEGRGEVFIDALFGSGLNKPLEGIAGHVADFINNSHCKVISIDVPSGLFCDALNAIDDKIIRADYTLTFQFPKLAFMFPETAEYTGEFSILDIGLHPEYIQRTATKNYFITKNDVSVFLKKRSKIAHKGNFGHALIVAGSYGKIGAAVLSAKACMRSGAGLLTVHVPECGYEILQISIPEAMVDIDSGSHFITDNIRVEKYNTIGIGPGIGTEKQTQNVVKLIIQNSSVPLVFDADAINCIAENKTWLSFIPPNCVFTPHPKEFERLAGKSKTSLERLQMQRDFSLKYNCYVVLKGAHTAVSCPNGDVFFNSTGNPGMATAGSGDVLTGIITSLLAQNYSSQEACILGVYLHGLAGDFASHKKSEESMTASDIIDHLSDGFNFLKN